MKHASRKSNAASLQRLIQAFQWGQGWNGEMEWREERIARIRKSVGKSARRWTPAETVVDWLAALEARLNRVPMFDGSLAQTPAKQHNLVVETEGEVQ